MQLPCRLPNRKLLGDIFNSATRQNRRCYVQRLLHCPCPLSCNGLPVCMRRTRRCPHQECIKFLPLMLRSCLKSHQCRPQGSKTTSERWRYPLSARHNSHFWCRSSPDLTLFKQPLRLSPGTVVWQRAGRSGGLRGTRGRAPER